MYPQRSVMTCGLATALEPPHFNHAPVRGATSGSSLRLCSLPCFNPRTRVGCDGTVNTKNMTSVQFQSTHPRGVRRGRPGNVHRDDSVSIHAPAWGATGRTGQGRAGKYLVSIHAPAWGATRPACAKPLPAQVSIHAPAWGATALERPVRAEHRVSIHAPAWGATQVARRRLHHGHQFQSTHPRGVRRFL